jgi:hypothetical protein
VKRLQSALLALGLSLVGCDSDAAEDRLVVTVGDGSTVNVDTFCDPSCSGAESIEVSLDYPREAYREAETIELLQYRVDYQLSDVGGDTPFFAGLISVVLGPGDGDDLTLKVVGNAQREHVVEEVGGDAVSGTATLKLTGYDWSDSWVTIEHDFPIRFADVEGDNLGAAGNGGSDGGGDASVP